MYPQENILNQTRPRRVGDRRSEILELLKRTPGFAGGTLQGQIDRSQTQYEPGQQLQEPYTPPPEGIELSSGQEQRPWKAGYGVGETDPLKRDAARIRAMIENPASNVLPGGQVETPHPMGRWKAAGLGALFGLAQGGPDTPLAARLAAGATGAGIGAAKPRAVQEWRRRMEVEDAQKLLGQQQKIGLGQAQLESEQAETIQRRAAPEIARAETERKARYDQERVRVQQQAAEGRISIAEATRKLREMELDERKRHNLETESISRTRPASDAQAAQAAEGEAIAASTQEAATALKSELDQHKGQLMENERAITQKEAWWNSQAAKMVAESAGEVKMAEAVAQVKAADPDYQNGGHDTLLNNTKALRDAVSTKEKEYRDMQGDIRKGSAKAARGSRRTSYSGRTMSTANLARYAKDKGISVEEARKKVEAQGVRVQ